MSGGATRVFVFPGQGSQELGMGRALADAFAPARAVFEEVDAALGQHLFRLMTDGPAEDLNRTENTQPALFAVSMATVRVLEAEGGFRLADKARFLAGHSLGEYAALAAAGTIGIAQGAKLLRRRGAAMQKAVPEGKGAMAALLGVDFDLAAAIAEEAAQGAVCSPANDNAPGQVVISGDAAAIDRAIEIGKAKGAKRAVKLAVSAPFHCALMTPAATEMNHVLRTEPFLAPALPIVPNVIARAETDPDRLRNLLVEQIAGTVRWRESVSWMAEQGVETLVELGAGKVLTGLAKRIDARLSGQAVGTPDGVEDFLKTL